MKLRKVDIGSIIAIYGMLGIAWLLKDKLYLRESYLLTIGLFVTVAIIAYLWKQR